MNVYLQVSQMTKYLSRPMFLCTNCGNHFPRLQARIELFYLRKICHWCCLEIHGQDNIYPYRLVSKILCPGIFRYIDG